MNHALVDALHGLDGRSPRICEIRRQIETIGPSRNPVLLLGESGTGKEVIARALHDVNPRGAFVPIDCGSLVGPLMESELFGHVKGAFTGATETKRGLIELANGGTVFFDEIGDLPLDLQVKLLRLLQEREFRAVGALNRQKIELRVIAATHRDLKRAVEEGKFRQDLYYRLDVLNVRLPALRDRKEDIPLLAETFLKRYGNYEIPADVMAALVEYGWPGNVRELQNFMARIAASNTGPDVGMEDLPSPILQSRLSAKVELSAMARFASGKEIVPLRDLERGAILEAIEFTKGDRARAAMLLGIGRTTLYRKMKEYNLEIEARARCNVQSG
jgi:DNA-binding NtrC family response regulator